LTEYNEIKLNPPFFFSFFFWIDNNKNWLAAQIFGLCHANFLCFFFKHIFSGAILLNLGAVKTGQKKKQEPKTGPDLF